MKDNAHGSHLQEFALAVDDEPDACLPLSIFLRSIGYETDMAHNGKEALEICEKREPSLVILDIRMPVMDGLKTLGHIRNAYGEGIIVVMLTAVNDFEMAMKAMKMGADDILGKPVRFEELKTAIDQAVEKRQRRERDASNVEWLESVVWKRTEALAQILALLNITNGALIRALAHVVELKDPFSDGRSIRTTELALRVGREMKLPDDQLATLEEATLLHDIGNAGVPGCILEQGRMLTDDEFEEVKRHTRVGYQILEGIEYLEQARLVVLHHHERLDGKGYPDKWDESRLDTITRIVSVVDTFDALMSDRPHRKGYSLDEALKILRECAGDQLDTEIVNMFIERRLYLRESEKDIPADAQ